MTWITGGHSGINFGGPKKIKIYIPSAKKNEK